MYNINYHLLIKSLLPSFLRKPKIEALLRSFINPILLLYTDFMLYIYLSDLKIQYSGQVIYLEKLLNDTYNTTAIYIEEISNIEYKYLSNNGEPIGSTIIYNKTGESNPVILYLKNENEFTSNYHFKIKVPQLLYNSLGNDGLIKMQALVNNYKIAGKQFLIESI